MRRLTLTLLSLVLSLLLLVAAAVAWALLTTSGARWLLGLAVDAEPRLSLEVTGGSLLSGLRLEEFDWRGDGLRFSAAAAEAEWSADCLFDRIVCLDQLRLRSPRLTVAPTGPAAAPAPELRLPVEVRVQLLQVSDARLDLPQAEISIDSLQAGGRFGEGTLTLHFGRAQGVNVVLPPPTAEASGGEAEDPIVLPSVDLPLDLVLEGVLLENLSLQRGEELLTLRSLALDGSLRGSELSLRGLRLVTEELSAELAGSATLSGDYPLDLRLSLAGEAPGVEGPLRVRARLGDTLRRLDVEAALEGALELSARGQLRPLDPRLPFSLQASAERLPWPVSGKPQVVLREASLRAEGNREGYRLSADAAVGGEALPPGTWRLQAAGDWESLTVERLAGRTLGGEVVATGRLDWSQALRWQAGVSARGIDPGRQWPDYPGRLSGRIETEGRLTEQGLSLRLRSREVEGRLRGYPVALRGEVALSPDGVWRLDGLRLSSGPNVLIADGRVGERWDLEGRFDLPRLTAMFPDLVGSGSGTFSLAGPLARPDVRLDLAGKDLRWGEDWAAEGLRATARLKALGYGDSTIEIEADDVLAAGEGFERAAARLTGSRSEHELALAVEGEPYGGQATFAGRLADNLDWRGRLLSSTLELPPQQRWTLTEPVALSFDRSRTLLRVEPHCWAQREARLCLTEPAALSADGDLALALADFRIDWLQPWLPEGMAWSGPLQARLDLAWGPGRPLDLEVSAESLDGRVRLAQEGSDQPLELGYRRLAARADLARGGLRLELALDSQALGEGSLTLRTAPGSRPRPLEGEVALAGLRLEVLKPFFPQVSTLAGTVAAEGRLGGTLQDPRFVGEVRLRDGAVAAPNLPMDLADVALTADVRGERAQLRGSFTSGEGQGGLTGELTWAGESWSADVALSGERLLFRYPPLARLRIDPDLKFHVAPRRVEVSGRIVVPEGKISLQELPEGAVAVSEDVAVIRRPGEQPRQMGPPEPPRTGWEVVSDVELVLGDEVEISGFGLEGNLAGNLRVRQRAQGVPEAVGELRIVDGRYEAYGQQLEIRTGQLLFSGPIREPALNIEAVREARGVTAGIRVTGRPEEPKVSLFSHPALPEEDVLSYIVRGRPLREAGGAADEQQLLAQAALQLGILGGRGVVGSLAKELGIRDFAIGAGGEGEGAQVEFSGYLSPNLYIQYGVGVFTPVNTLTLRYRLDDDLYLQAVSGLESALDIFYEFTF